MYYGNYVNGIVRVEEFLFPAVPGEDNGIGQLPGFDLVGYRDYADMQKAKRIRVLLAKPSQDGHDRDVRMAALTFLDAGFEVIYMGCRQTPEQILSAAIQEDVDLIGLNILPGANGYSLSRILELLKQNNAEHISVIGLGAFPSEDIHKLREMGIKEVFEPGANPRDIQNWVGNNVMPRRESVLER
jgi:methylmalonyl-CoA mutase C-terminal domain/subunit